MVNGLVDADHQLLLPASEDLGEVLAHGLTHVLLTLGLLIGCNPIKILVGFLLF
ncbi:hypothetical protein D3C72_2454010 [compost metagenome]